MKFWEKGFNPTYTQATVRDEPLYSSCRIRQGLYVRDQLDYLS